MPIAFTTLGTPLASTSNTTSYATASQSPTASRLLLAAVLLSRGSSTNPVTPTLSGNGLTWALVNDGVTSGDQPFPPTGTLRYRLCLFQAQTGGSPSAGALTVDCGGVTHTGCAVIVGESDDEVDLADAIVQVDTVLHAFGAGPAAASMAAFDDANNAAFSCWALDITAAITHEGSELGDVTYSTPAARLEAQYLATQDTTPGVNWTGSANAAGIAVEVRLAAVGATLTPAMLTHARTVFAPAKVSPQLRPALLVHARSVFAPDLDTTVRPALQIHARAIHAPQVNPSVAPDILTHTRTVFSPTVVAAGALLLPDRLTHTRTVYEPQINPSVLPGLITHTRTVFDPTVGPTLKPPLLTHARSVFTPNVVHVITAPLVTHTRQTFDPQLNVAVTLPMLVHDRAVYEPAFPGIPGVGASHTHSIHPHRHRDGDDF